MSMPRTEAALEALEQALCENAGSMVDACRSLAISPFEVHQWTLADPLIASRIHTAQMIGWASLEAEAYRRAVHGVTEAVYYQGEVVGEKRVYSDGLLQTMMKARVPGYGGDGEGASRSLTVNVAIMPRASNYEEWLEHKQVALESPTVPAEEIVEGLYTALPTPQHEAPPVYDADGVGRRGHLPDWL